MKADPALKSNRSPSRSNSVKPSQGWGTGLRKEATFLLFQAAEPGGAVSSFDLQVKGLSQPLRSPSNDKGVIAELSKVTEMYLSIGILLSFKDSTVPLQMFGKEVPFIGGVDFSLKGTHQRPSASAD